MRDAEMMRNVVQNNLVEFIGLLDLSTQVMLDELNRKRKFLQNIRRYSKLMDIPNLSTTYETNSSEDDDATRSVTNSNEDDNAIRSVKEIKTATKYEKAQQIIDADEVNDATAVELYTRNENSIDPLSGEEKAQLERAKLVATYGADAGAKTQGS